MDIARTKAIGCGFALCMLLANSAFASTIPLSTKKECGNLGGAWTQAAMNTGRVGSCELPSGFVIAPNDLLELYGSVDLKVSNGARLTIDGTLSVFGGSTLHSISGGVVTVTASGTLSMENQSLFVIENGWLDNSGAVRSEGIIRNGKGSGTVATPAIFNSGIIQLFSSGTLENSGEYIDVGTTTVPRSATLLVDRRGKFINKPGARAHPAFAQI